LKKTKNNLNIIHDFNGILLYQDAFATIGMDKVLEGIEWRNDSITFFGKTYPQPRLTAWYGDAGVEYTYSKIKMIAQGWTPELLKLKIQLEKTLEKPFNSVLINYYRNGLDHMSYHTDDEKSLGENPTIASLSFGATRKFYIKHRFDKNIKAQMFELKSQSLLVMKDEFQHFWLHKIAKSKTINEARLNLTFRYIKEN
jgi:alkylated DNA repair dioxygenase AlkB